MSVGNFFESSRIVVKNANGRHRLVHKGTGKLFLNPMGHSEDGGGYDTEHDAINHAKRLNTRLQVILRMGGIKPGISNDRAVAFVLWLDGGISALGREAYANECT